MSTVVLHFLFKSLKYKKITVKKCLSTRQCEWETWVREKAERQTHSSFRCLWGTGSRWASLNTYTVASSCASPPARLDQNPVWIIQVFKFLALLCNVALTARDNSLFFLSPIYFYSSFSRFRTLFCFMSRSSEARARAWSWKPRTSIPFFSFQRSEFILSAILHCDCPIQDVCLYASALSFFRTFSVLPVTHATKPYVSHARLQPRTFTQPYCMTNIFSSSAKPCIIREETKRKRKQVTSETQKIAYLY